MTLSSQESDFYLDDGDDLVKAFLEQEQEAGITIKQAGTQGRRSRTRSASPGPANPHGMGVKVKVEAKGSQPKSLKLDRSPSLEIIDVKSANKLENGPVLKQEPTSSSPIIIVEAPVSWPPSKVPASDYIKEAHATHRKYMAGTSTPQSSSDGRRGDHQTQVKRDEEMNPVIKKRKTTASFKGKVEEVVMRNEQGNLTEQGRRALDKRLLESLGHEENAITNSDLYSRTQHIIAAATGHQVSNRGGAKYSLSGKDYNTSRNQKLKQQFTAANEPVEGDAGLAGGSVKAETFVVQSRIFAGCTMWLNGYSGNKITDMALKKLIAVHGGTISMSEGSRITHVLVSERISGTKAEKFLRGATKAYTKNGKKKVVLVDWVLDSVKQGKKLGEAAYNVIENEAQPTIISKLGFSSAPPSRTRSNGEPTKSVAATLDSRYIEIVDE